MSKRYLVLGLSVVLALALAVPALGGPSNPIASISASVKKTANKALKRANQAKKQAKNAIGKANSAQSSANSAQSSANGANSAANKAQETADGAQSSADSAKSAADGAQGSANSAKATADAALAAAEAAEANANSRLKGFTYFNFGEATETDTDTSKVAGAECDGEDPFFGGGYAVTGTGDNQVTVEQNLPDFLYGDSWFVSAEAISGTPSWALQAVIICGESGA